MASIWEQFIVVTKFGQKWTAAESSITQHRNTDTQVIETGAVKQPTAKQFWADNLAA